MNKTVVFVLGVLAGAIVFNKKTRKKISNFGSSVVDDVKAAFGGDEDEDDEDDDEVSEESGDEEASDEEADSDKE